SLRSGTTTNLDIGVGVAVAGIGVNLGDTSSELDFMDMNGDRLPDAVYTDGVRFNRGGVALDDKSRIDFKFSGDDDGAKDMRYVQHRSGGEHVGTSFKVVNETDSAGNTKALLATGIHFGTDYGMSQTAVDFIDINGDGLPDHVKHSGGNTTVRLNLG